MNFFLLLLGIWLLPKADALKCNECISDQAGGTCTNKQVECSSNQQCATLREIYYEGGAERSNVLSKRCVPTAECGESSFNYANFKTSFVIECCNTDLCNTKDASAPSKSIPNKMKCYGCVGLPCNRTLNCESNQDRCITSTVTDQGGTKVARGCATKNICSSPTFPTFLQGNKIVGKVDSCCEGDFCNSATTATASLLAVPLISLVLFY
uniref:UPAR/Ly6 domain-containing protein n=1 Tax=Oryzias latipes TaxID=8090 RepID=A0A3P9H3N2_ORYLA